MIEFYKYQGTGNDFILIDNRSKNTMLNMQQIEKLCDRKFGIGADGLMLLESEIGYDFRMVYYNSDGNESTMCGNGGRCITAFAQHLGLVRESAFFVAIDGEHRATISADGIIALQMNDVKSITHFDTYSLLNTGSPHYVLWQNDVQKVNVFELGKTIRYSEEFAPKGINVNFAERKKNGLFVRTYERGVEDETLSCGTGVTACAIASTDRQTGYFEIEVQTPGGLLSLHFNKNAPNEANEIILSGPATFVFSGAIEI